MDSDCLEKSKVKISIVKFLQKFISDFPKEIKGQAPTPATDQLFDVRDEKERKLLDKDHAIAFHYTVAHLLFASLRYRRGLQTAVAFLSTRVKEPDEDDWGKLKRLMRCIKLTVYTKLTLKPKTLQY